MPTENNHEAAPDQEAAQATEAGTVEPQKSETPEFNEVDELKLQFRELESKYHEALKQRKRLSQELQESKKTKAVEAGDIEQLRASLEAEIEEERKAREEVSQRYRELVLERGVLGVAKNKLTDAGVEFLLMKHKADFEITDEGSVRLQASAKSVEQFVQEFAAKYPDLAKSGVKPGGGTGAAGAGAKANYQSLEEIARLSDEEQKRAFAENPELMKLFAGVKLSA